MKVIAMRLLLGFMKYVTFAEKKSRLRAYCGRGVVKVTNTVCTSDLHPVTRQHLMELTSLVRCALTFLSIQAPRASKFCNICGKQYINEGKIRYGDLAASGMLEASGDMHNHDGSVANPSASVKGEIAQAGGMHGGTMQRPACLARMLFAACDMCIYCGGKFVG